MKRIFRKYFVTYIFTSLLVPSFSFLSLAQESANQPALPGQWIYTNQNLSDEWYSERFYKMNTSELQKYHGTVEKLLNYLHNQPIAQKPSGVTLNVKSRAAYIHDDHIAYPVKADERVKAEIYIPFCSLVQKNGKVEYSCDEVSYVDLITNDESQIYESAMNYDMLEDHKAVNQYREIFILPRKLMDLGSGVFLYDWYYKNRIIISRSDRQLWLPISNREYTNRMMIYHEASLKEGKITQMLLDALRNEIAAIPPELMSQPAYLNGNTLRPLTSICSSEEDSASALYKLNPAYFDPKLPRTAVQLITITIEGHADDPDWGEINAHRVWEFIKGLKGSDLKEFLDVRNN